MIVRQTPKAPERGCVAETSRSTHDNNPSKTPQHRVIEGAAAGLGNTAALRLVARCAQHWIALALLAFTSYAQPVPAHWKQLPSLPDPIGLAGSFAGVSSGALIVAGGANFPGSMPWEGGKKVWHDSIFVLPKPDSNWLPGFKLPHPIAYGVSVTIKNGVLCARGSGERKHFRDVFVLSWSNGKIETESLPPLPHALANGCGALVGNTVYVAGGIERPDATNAMPIFWSFDLAATKAQWQKLKPWPGPARMLAVAGVYAGDFFLFSGVDLKGDAAGEPIRVYLRDAYRFTPSKGWKRIADLPRAAAAAPSPAITRVDELLIVSGDDGSQVNFQPQSAHPGFSKDVLAYYPADDKWKTCGDSPLTRATVPVVQWQGMAIIPNGEIAPGRRTPEVWGFELPR